MYGILQHRQKHVFILRDSKYFDVHVPIIGILVCSFQNHGLRDFRSQILQIVNIQVQVHVRQTSLAITSHCPQSHHATKIDYYATTLLQKAQTNKGGFSQRK